MSDAGTIVVVEDDPDIAGLLDLYLRQAGFRVLQTADGERALELVAEHRPRLVVLDLGLPGPLDGLDVCKRLRASGPSAATPVLVVTARGDEIDRVLGFELGADDYVTKPFSPREVVARIKAILRRADGRSGEAAVRQVGTVTIDLGRREVRVDERAVELTTREFDLLSHLAEHEGLVLSRRQLLDGAWGTGWVGDERTVDVHVGQLRKKLGEALPLATVWGVGYRLG